eukprot:COSAG02_NODE_14588_length_1257_cov_0.945596_1_plen_211_part_00
MALRSTRQPHSRHTRRDEQHRDQHAISSTTAMPRPTVWAAEWFVTLSGATASAGRRRARLSNRPGGAGHRHRSPCLKTILSSSARSRGGLCTRTPFWSSARGVRPHVGVTLSWSYAQASQRVGRWQQRPAWRGAGRLVLPRLRLRSGSTTYHQSRRAGHMPHRRHILRQFAQGFRTGTESDATGIPTAHRTHSVCTERPTGLFAFRVAKQ